MSRNDAAPVRATGLVHIFPSRTGPVHALRDVDVAFRAGDVSVVAGPSGSGKSTLLRIVATLDRPTAGTVEVVGHRIENWSGRRRRLLRRSNLAFVLQRPSHNLFEQLTVGQHLQHAARIGTSGARVDLAELIERLDLTGLVQRRPHQLSGGEQQRVALAAAAAASTSVLIADEPTAELDLDSARQVLDMLGQLARTGCCVIVSSHDPAVIAASDTTVRLRHGAIESETRHGYEVAIIDGSGRVQLPPHVLALFPERRVRLQANDDHVRLDPP